MQASSIGWRASYIGSIIYCICQGPSLQAKAPPESNRGHRILARRPLLSARGSPISTRGGPPLCWLEDLLDLSPMLARRPPGFVKRRERFLYQYKGSLARGNPMLVRGPPVFARGHPKPANEPPISAKGPPVSAREPPISVTCCVPGGLLHQL